MVSGNFKPSIIVVHPSRLFSDGLGSLLRETPYRLALYTPCADNIILEPDQVTGTHIFMVGGRTSGQITQAIRTIRKRASAAHIVVIGGGAEPDEVMSALEAGADGYLREEMTSQTLLAAIELVMQDEIILPPEFVKCLRGASKLNDHKGFEATYVHHNSEDDEENSGGVRANNSAGVKLSAREDSILKGLIEGSPNKVIAQRLSITEATVKVHVKAILRMSLSEIMLFSDIAFLA